MTCWQNLQVRVQVQVHSFQVQVQVRVLRAKVQVQVQVQQKRTSVRTRVLQVWLEYFLSPAKADLLPTDGGGGSSARSDPPVYGPVLATNFK